MSKWYDVKYSNEVTTASGEKINAEIINIVSDNISPPIEKINSVSGRLHVKLFNPKKDGYIWLYFKMPSGDVLCQELKIESDEQ